MGIIRCINIKKLFPVVVLAGALVCSLLGVLLKGQPLQAQGLSIGTNTVVFTGQVIPAYEGAAYDPTLAYQYLSGLPIYVFVYDNWDPVNDDWIVNNRVVRTQIRADGTFQAMGLPHGANYGVYFPYKEICIDRTGISGGTEEGCWDPVDQDYHVRQIVRSDGHRNWVPTTADFRSPWVARSDRDHDGIANNSFIDRYSDGLVDVFSYGFLECNSVTPSGSGPVCSTYTGLRDQTGQAVSIEEEFVFVTSTNRLDVESHINIFPLVPATTLRVAAGVSTAGARNTTVPQPAEGGHVEMYAQRVARRISPRELWSLSGETVQEIFGPWTSLGQERLNCSGGYNCESEWYLGSGGRSDGVPDGCLGSSSAECSPPTFVATSGVTIGGRGTNAPPAGRSYFKSFAPPGYYMVTLWKSDEGIPYQNYSSGLPLGTDYNGVTGFMVDNPSDSHWNACYNERHDLNVVSDPNFCKPGFFGTPEDSSIQEQQSNVWGTITREVPVQWKPSDSEPWEDAGTINVMAQLAATTLETVGTAGNFDYDGRLPWSPSNTNVTNEYGIYIYTGSLTKAHGAKVGFTGELDVNHNGSFSPAESNYLESYDTLHVSEADSLKKAQGLTIKGEKQRGGWFYGNVGSSGRRGLEVSTICTTCVADATSGAEKSTLRGTTGYRRPLSREGPGYFYLAPSWFSQNEDYRVIISNASLSAVCKLEAADIIDIHSGLENIVGLCEMIHGSTSGEAIVLEEKPSNRTNVTAGLIPQLHIPSVYAQQVNIPSPCDPAASDYILPADQCATDANCVHLEGVYGSPGVTYGGWQVEAVARYQTFWGEVWEQTEDYFHNEADFWSSRWAQPVGQRFSLTSLFLWVNKGTVLSGHEVESTLGLIDVNEDDETFTWDIACDELTDTAYTMPVVLSISARDPDGNVQASGNLEMTVEPAFTGDNLDGWEFSTLQPNVVISPECPSISIAHPIRDFAPWALCGVARGIANQLPGAFDFLAKTMLHTEPLTESPAVIALWNVMRNLANLFTVLMLIVIGVMTVLRIDPRTFEPSSALGALLVSLLLINFSLLLCEAFIDVNNMLVVYVFDIFTGVIQDLVGAGMTSGGAWGSFAGVAGMGGYLGASVIGGLTTTLGVAAVTGGGAIPAAVVGLLTFLIGIILGLVMFLMGLIMLYLVRYAVIWLLVIVAPLIFFMNNIPSMQDIRKTWFKMFIGFTLLQTFTAIIIGVGMAMLLSFGAGGAGFWQAARQLLIATGVFFMAVVSPTSLLGALGLDVGAGKVMGMASQFSEPLQKKLGGLRERFGTAQGLMDRETEWAATDAQLRAEGKSGFQRGATKWMGRLVPGWGDMTRKRLQAKRIKRKAVDEEDSLKKAKKKQENFEDGVPHVTATAVRGMAYGFPESNPAGTWGFSDQEYRDLVVNNGQMTDEEREEWGQLYQQIEQAGWFSLNRDQLDRHRQLRFDALGRTGREALGVAAKDRSEVTYENQQGKKVTTRAGMDGGWDYARNIASINIDDSEYEMHPLLVQAQEERSDELEHYKRRVTNRAFAVKETGGRAVELQEERVRALEEQREASLEQRSLMQEMIQRLESEGAGGDLVAQAHALERVLERERGRDPADQDSEAIANIEGRLEGVYDKIREKYSGTEVEEEE